MQDRGRRFEVPHLVVRWIENASGGPRFGLAVSRRVGNAVVRNRVKRWLREALRHERGALAGVDVVLIARPGAAGAGYEALRQGVGRALDRIRRERSQG